MGGSRSRGGKWLFSVCGHMEFIKAGALPAWRGWLGLSPSFQPAVVGTGWGAGWRPQSSLICNAKQILAVPWGTAPAPSALSTPQSSLLIGAPKGAGVPPSPNAPSSKFLRGDPSGRKAGGMQGMGGPCLAWGLASSQSDGGLPPPHRTCRQIFVPRLRRTARRNFILAPTCGSAAWH